MDSYALGLTIYDMCSIDRPTEEKKRVFSDGICVRINEEYYSAELRNWIRLLIDPDHTKRPTPADTLA